MSEREEMDWLEKMRLCLGGGLIGCIVGGSLASIFDLPLSETEWKCSLVGLLITAVLLFAPQTGANTK